MARLLSSPPHARAPRSRLLTHSTQDKREDRSQTAVGCGAVHGTGGAGGSCRPTGGCPRAGCQGEGGAGEQEQRGLGGQGRRRPQAGPRLCQAGCIIRVANAACLPATMPPCVCAWWVRGHGGTWCNAKRALSWLTDAVRGAEERRQEQRQEQVRPWRLSRSTDKTMEACAAGRGKHRPCG